MRVCWLVVAALALTGCFHEGESDASDRFRERVNAICVRHDTQFEALGKPPASGVAGRGRGEWDRAAQRISREIAAAFERLDAPQDLDPALAAWRRQIDVVYRRAAVASRAAKRMERVGSQRVSEAELDARADAFGKAVGALQAPQARLEVLGRRAGLDECVDDER